METSQTGLAATGLRSTAQRCELLSPGTIPQRFPSAAIPGQVRQPLCLSQPAALHQPPSQTRNRATELSQPLCGLRFSLRIPLFCRNRCFRVLAFQRPGQTAGRMDNQKQNQQQACSTIQQPCSRSPDRTGPGRIGISLRQQNGKDRHRQEFIGPSRERSAENCRSALKRYRCRRRLSKDRISPLPDSG